jgi:DNA repair exonuclease SbcCD ATPase subunit
MNDKMREALEEVCRVLESNDSAIVDTIWVSTGQPETLLDHCKEALSQSEPVQVSQPYAYEVSTKDEDELVYAIYYTKYKNQLPEGAKPLFLAPPDYEALKERLKVAEKLSDRSMSSVRKLMRMASDNGAKYAATNTKNDALQKMYDSQCECTDEWAEKYNELLSTVSQEEVENLKSQIATLNGRLFQRNEENEALKAENKELNQRVANWETTALQSLDNIWGSPSYEALKQQLENLKSSQEIELVNANIEIEELRQRVAELKDILTSARSIAKRRGVDTAWDTFDRRIERAGIGHITAKNFRGYKE